MQDSITNIFRAYDIRGIYGSDLFGETAERIGVAACADIGSKGTIVVGMDARESSGVLKSALIEGMTSAGCNVIDIGTVPSPVLYFSAKHLTADRGVIVTASHLPPEWNGFKFCDKGGIVISEGTGLEKIRSAFFEKDAEQGQQGSVVDYREILLDYSSYISGKIRIKKGLKAVFDYGNSVTSLAMGPILQKFPINATEINKEIKQSSPDRTSELTEEALTGLRIAVLEEGADVGIAYDGDGDRVAFVDGKGKILNTGNLIIPIFSNYYLERNPGGAVVYDVTCSDSVSEFIKSRGGRSIITKVGHSYCASEVIKSGAILGGQYSGHMVFPEIGCADDALYASLKMLEILSSSERTLNEMAGKIPQKKATGVFEYKVADSMKFDAVRKISKTIKKAGMQYADIDGLKILTDHGWVLIRASNTSPAIKINAESDTCEEAEALQEYGKNLVKEAILLD